MNALIMKASGAISEIFVTEKVVHMGLMGVYDSRPLDKQCN